MKRIGFAVLALGAIIVVLSTAYLITLPKSRPQPLTWSEEAINAWRKRDGLPPAYCPRSEPAKTAFAVERSRGYSLIGVGIILCLIGLLVAARHDVYEKRLSAVLSKFPDKGVLGFTIGRITAAALLIWALRDHAYEYYTLLRFVVCGVTTYGVYLAGRNKKIGWAWIFGIIAVLFNPIVPVHLERATWAIIDVGVSLFLMTSIALFKAAKLPTEE